MAYVAVVEARREADTQFKALEMALRRKREREQKTSESGPRQLAEKDEKGQGRRS